MQYVFNRKELKFVTGEREFRRLMRELPRHARLDEYNRDGKAYPVYSIYLDTVDFDLARLSFDKDSSYRYKVRLRSYTDFSDPEELIFVEIKKKVSGASNKRRTRMKYREAMEFMETGELPEIKGYMNGQVVRELGVLFRKMKMRPVMHISYSRYAFAGSGDLRITVDQDVIARDLSSGVEWELLGDKKNVLEVKAGRAIPMEVAELISELKLGQRSFSKYGNGYVNLLQDRQKSNNRKKEKKNV